MWSDTNEYHDGYQLSISHECGSTTINLAKDCHLYKYYCPWGSVNVTAKVRAYIGEDYGPWSNITTTLNAPNKPSNLRVSVKHVCGWPNYAKLTPSEPSGEFPGEILEEIWIPADSLLELRPRDDYNDPPCFPTNEIRVTWDTPEHQLEEPDYYKVRLLFYTTPVTVDYVGPIYGQEAEICTWENWEQRISVVAYKYGLHSNETEEMKIITTGNRSCYPYSFGKSSPPDDGQEPLSDKSNLTPVQFSLSQNHPNPFNPETEISYSLPQDCRVKLIIFNLMGQKVRDLVDEYQTAGHKTVHWDGKDHAGNEVASGIYFYRLQAGNHDKVRKMILTK
jgi:hypothetical protein